MTWKGLLVIALGTPSLWASDCPELLFAHVEQGSEQRLILSQGARLLAGPPRALPLRTLYVDHSQTPPWIWTETAGPEQRWIRAFSNAAARIAVSAASPTRLQIWDLQEQTLLQEFALRGHPVLEHVVFSLDGQRVAAADYAGLVRVWDLETGAVKESSQLDTPFEPRPVDLVFSADAQNLFMQFRSGRVTRWNFDSGVISTILPPRQSRLEPDDLDRNAVREPMAGSLSYGLALSQDEKHLFVGTLSFQRSQWKSVPPSGALRVFDAQTGRLLSYTETEQFPHEPGTQLHPESRTAPLTAFLALPRSTKVVRATVHFPPFLENGGRKRRPVPILETYDFSSGETTVLQKTLSRSTNMGPEFVFYSALSTSQDGRWLFAGTTHGWVHVFDLKSGTRLIKRKTFGGGERDLDPNRAIQHLYWDPAARELVYFSSASGLSRLFLVGELE